MKLRRKQRIHLVQQIIRPFRSFRRLFCSQPVSRILSLAFLTLTKSSVGTIFSLAFLTLTAATAVAQTIQPGTFKHIIIVVQENRTPDNLFGAGAGPRSVCGSEYEFEPGVDIDNGGPNKTLGGTTCNMPLPLNGWDSELLPSSSPTPQPVGAIDPDHSYNGNGQYPNGWGWVYDFDFNTTQQKGLMDGFCHGTGYVPGAPHPCPAYSYVPLGGDVNNYDNGDITPYYNIAKAYGFGNYMFQTHEGPSFEAHQFLFSGTSAPVSPGWNYDEGQWDLDFVAELAGSQYGCQEKGIGANWVYPDGTEFGGDQNIAECYPHDTLVTAAADCPPGGGEGYCDRLVGGAPIMGLLRAKGLLDLERPQCQSANLLWQHGFAKRGVMPGPGAAAVHRVQHACSSGEREWLRQRAHLR